MNPQMELLLMCLAGGLGAVSRFVLDAVIRGRVDTRWPVGTMVINVLGSFALGLLTAAVLHHGLASSWKLVLGTGFLGGFTTFSTACVETVRLVEGGRSGFALVKAIVQIVLAVGAAVMGYALLA